MTPIGEADGGFPSQAALDCDVGFVVEHISNGRRVAGKDGLVDNKDKIYQEFKDGKLRAADFYDKWRKLVRTQLVGKTSK